MTCTRSVIAALALSLAAGGAGAETPARPLRPPAVGADAQISDGVVKIGVLNDQSSLYADLAGQGSGVAARVAGGGVGAAARGGGGGRACPAGGGWARPGWPSRTSAPPRRG